MVKTAMTSFLKVFEGVPNELRTAAASVRVVIDAVIHTEQGRLDAPGVHKLPRGTSRMHGPACVQWGTPKSAKKSNTSMSVFSWMSTLNRSSVKYGGQYDFCLTTVFEENRRRVCCHNSSSTKVEETEGTQYISKPWPTLPISGSLPTRTL